MQDITRKLFGEMCFADNCIRQEAQSGLARRSHHAEKHTVLQKPRADFMQPHHAQKEHVKPVRLIRDACSVESYNPKSYSGATRITRQIGDCASLTLSGGSNWAMRTGGLHAGVGREGHNLVQSYEAAYARTRARSAMTSFEAGTAAFDSSHMTSLYANALVNGAIVHNIHVQ